MAKTKIADILDPEILSDKAATYFPGKVAFVGTGVADVGGSKIDQGGTRLTVPKFKKAADEFDDLSEDTGLTPKKLEQYKEETPVIRRGIAYEIGDIADLVMLDDPNEEVAVQISTQAGRTIDRSFINVTIGATPAANTYDVSADSGAKVLIEGTHVINALLKVGDELENLRAIIMHSKVYGDLLQNNLIDYVQESEVDRIPTYMGRRVFVSDRTPVDTSNDNNIYSTYLVGNGSFFHDFQAELDVEFDRDILDKSDLIAADVHYCVHLRGTNWKTSSPDKPTKAQVKDTANWEQAAESNKEIKLVALLTN